MRISDWSSDVCSSDLARKRELIGLRQATLVAAVLTVPVFGIEMGSHFVPAIHDFVMNTIGTQTSWTIQFVLTTIILFGPGRRFFQKGVPAMLPVTPDLKQLGTVGTISPWGLLVVAPLDRKVARE